MNTIEQTPGAAAHSYNVSHWKLYSVPTTFANPCSLFLVWHLRKIPFQSCQLYSIGNAVFCIILILHVCACSKRWFFACVFCTLSIYYTLCKSISNHIHNIGAHTTTHDKTITAYDICKHWANSMCKFKHHVNNDWKHQCKRTTGRKKGSRKNGKHEASACWFYKMQILNEVNKQQSVLTQIRVGVF